MSMEFTEQEVGSWLRGGEIAELYERGCDAARQLPRYSVRFVAVTSQSERPEIEFGLKFFMKPTIVNRIRRDIGVLAAGPLADVSIAIENQTAENPMAGCYTGELPVMHDKTWEMLQEHWEQVRALGLPFKSLRTFLLDPVLSSVVTHYDSPYPSLHTEAEAAFTSTEEKITLYERVHEADFQHDGGLSAYAFTVPQLHFKMGDTHPSKLKLKVYDCTPGGWASQRMELADYEREYPNGVPGLDT